MNENVLVHHNAQGATKAVLGGPMNPGNTMTSVLLAMSCLKSAVRASGGALDQGQMALFFQS